MITESTVAAPPTNLDTDTIRLNRSITARNYWKKRLDGIVPQVYFRSYLPVDPGLMPVDGYVQQPDPALRDRLNITGRTGYPDPKMSSRYGSHCVYAIVRRYTKRSRRSARSNNSGCGCRFS
jgi:hypothetical protein